MQESKNKNERIMDIYTRLLEGRTVNKEEIAEKYGVDRRSVQRDLADIRDFLNKKGCADGSKNELRYDRKLHGYRLETMNQMKFTNSEALAVSKILLDSRALTKEEMDQLLEKLLDCCVPADNQDVVKDMIFGDGINGWLRSQGDRVEVLDGQ